MRKPLQKTSKIISENFEKYFGMFEKYIRNFWELFWKFSKTISENIENYCGGFGEWFHKISEGSRNTFTFSISIFLKISRNPSETILSNVLKISKKFSENFKKYFEKYRKLYRKISIRTQENFKKYLGERSENFEK